MMRWLSVLLVLVALPLRGAVGDIISGAVETNGYVLRLEVALGTNSTFFNGFVRVTNSIGTNVITYEVPGTTNSLQLSLTRMGFDDTGAGIMVAKTLLGTKLLRRPDPDELINDVITNDTTAAVVLRIALSDFVSSRDSNLVATLRAGAVVQTNTATESAATASLTVTNLSVQPYWRPVGKWVGTPFNVVTGSTVTLRCVAFDRSAKDGRPVRAVKFWTSDGTHNVTNWVTGMTVDRSQGDAQPGGEYVVHQDISTMDNNALMVHNFAAYGWEGDEPLDTSTTGWQWPTAMPAPLTNICGRLGTYGVTVARVASTGDDGTGLAANETYYATNQSPPAFATIAGALSAIRGTNNGSYGRDEFGHGVVKLSAEAHGWLGASVSVPTGNQGWCTIEPDIGVADWAASISGYVTDERAVDDKDRLKVSRVYINVSTSPFYKQHIWLDKCLVKGSGATIFQTGAAVVNSWYLTQCTVSNVVQGLVSYSGQKLTVPLVRGCWFDGFNNELFAGCVVFNSTKGAEGANMFVKFDDSAVQTYESAQWGIVYNNYFAGLDRADNILAGPKTLSQTNGYAIIQNVFEATPETDVSVFDFGSDNAVHLTNAVVWNNAVVGGRNFFGYNDVGAAPAYRYGWTVIGNYWDDYNIKTDTFDTQDAARIGNWPLVYGVGYYGNVDMCVSGIGTTAFFNSENQGIPKGAGGYDGLAHWNYYVFYGGAGVTNYTQFTARKSWNGASTGEGFGNYRLRSASPQFSLPTQWVLPFDLDGQPRSRLDPPGAYAAGNPKKGMW